MVSCIGGDKRPCCNTPVERPKGENAEGGQYSADKSSVAEKNSEYAIKRCVVAAFAQFIVDLIGYYSCNAIMETKQQFV